MRINAIYHLLYESKTAPLAIEKLLIEMLIQKTIQKDFEKNQYYTCLIPRFDAVFSYAEENDHIRIKLNPMMLKLGKDIIAEEIKLLQKTVKEITKERDEAREQLAVNKKELFDKENSLQLMKEELRATQDKLVAKKDELGATKDELGTTKDALRVTREKLEARELALAIKNQEEQQTLLFALQRQELAMLATMSNKTETEHQAMKTHLLQPKTLTLFSSANATLADKAEEENTVYQKIN